MKLTKIRHSSWWNYIFELTFFRLGRGDWVNRKGISQREIKWKVILFELKKKKEEREKFELFDWCDKMKIVIIK